MVHSAHPANRYNRTRRYGERGPPDGASGGLRHSCPVVLFPVVATVMTKGTVTPLVTLIAVGTEQAADTGAPAQVKATLPLKPEVSCRLNVAVCPAVTVAERLAPGVGAIVTKLFALPLRLTICGEFGASSSISSRYGGPGLKIENRLRSQRRRPQITSRFDRIRVRPRYAWHIDIQEPSGAIDQNRIRDAARTQVDRCVQWGRRTRGRYGCAFNEAHSGTPSVEKELPTRIERNGLLVRVSAPRGTRRGQCTGC